MILIVIFCFLTNDAYSQVNDQTEGLWRNVTIFNHLKRYKKALEITEEIIKIQPQSPEALKTKGNFLHQLGKRKDALKYYDKAIVINPLDHDAYYNKGLILAEIGKYYEAIDAYNKAITIAPQYAEIHTAKGIALAKLKKLRSRKRPSNDKDSYYNKRYNKGKITSPKAELKDYKKDITIEKSKVIQLDIYNNQTIGGF